MKFFCSFLSIVLVICLKYHVGCSVTRDVIKGRKTRVTSGSSIVGLYTREELLEAKNNDGEGSPVITAPLERKTREEHLYERQILSLSEERGVDDHSRSDHPGIGSTFGISRGDLRQINPDLDKNKRNWKFGRASFRDDIFGDTRHEIDSVRSLDRQNGDTFDQLNIVKDRVYDENGPANGIQQTKTGHMEEVEVFEDQDFKPQSNQNSWNEERDEKESLLDRDGFEEPSVNNVEVSVHGKQEGNDKFDDIGKSVFEFGSQGDDNDILKSSDFGGDRHQGDLEDGFGQGNEHGISDPNNLNDGQDQDQNDFSDKFDTKGYFDPSDIENDFDKDFNDANDEDNSHGSLNGSRETCC